MNIFVMSLNRF